VLAGQAACECPAIKKKRCARELKEAGYKAAKGQQQDNRHQYHSDNLEGQGTVLGSGKTIEEWPGTFFHVLQNYANTVTLTTY